MGWRSYYLIYNTDTQLTKYLRLIYEHNFRWFSGKYDVGQELIAPIFSKTKQGTNCLLFGNAGGSHYTFEFFGRRGVQLNEYMSDTDKLLLKKHPIVKHPNPEVRKLGNKIEELSKRIEEQEDKGADQILR